MHEAVGGLPLCSFLHLLEAKLYHKSFHSRGIGRLQVLLPKRLVPKFDMVAGADNFDVFLQTCILAQTRGYEYPALRVELCLYADEYKAFENLRLQGSSLSRIAAHASVL